MQSDNTIELGAAAKLQPNLGNKLTRVHGEDVQPGITLVFVSGDGTRFGCTGKMFNPACFPTGALTRANSRGNQW